jgi:hypothetical protein
MLRFSSFGAPEGDTEPSLEGVGIKAPKSRPRCLPRPSGGPLFQLEFIVRQWGSSNAVPNFQPPVLLGVLRPDERALDRFIVGGQQLASLGLALAEQVALLVGQPALELRGVGPYADCQGKPIRFLIKKAARRGLG